MLRARKLRELTIDRQGPVRDYVFSASGLVRTGDLTVRNRERLPAVRVGGDIRREVRGRGS